MHPLETPRARLALALAIPLVAFVVQSAVWSLITPFRWSLFYPAVFVASWIGGLRAGLLATALSMGLVLVAFAPESFGVRYFVGAGVFVTSGVMFSFFHARLRRATTEIAALYAKLRELDEIKTKVFAHISHELRSPLALILGPTERWLEAIDAADPRRRDLELIQRNARTLLRHIDDLLEVAKLEANEMTLEHADVDVARLVRFVSGLYADMAEHKQIAFTQDVPATLTAQVDPEKLQRIVHNLLANAFKFTPAGGNVRIGVHARDARVVLEVADDGPGVPRDRRELVFLPFRQVDEGSRRRFGGTGLGLAIVRELVTLHGGTVDVRDAPEGGALFVVELPRAAPPDAVVRPASALAGIVRDLDRPVVAPTPRAPRSRDGRGPLVLIVEDNPEMNEFLSEALGEVDDYRVRSARDGREALAMATAEPPDVIISDVMMPELSGDELVEAIRRRPELDATPIVLLTAKADDRLRIEMLRRGADDYVTKPFSLDELRVRIANLIARKRAEDQAARELEQITDRLAAHRQVERLREEWAEIVAHDLQQPINAIRLGLDLLLRANLGPKERETGLRIRDSIMRFGRMIEDLKDVSALETGRLALEPTTIDLVAHVRDVVARQLDLGSRVAVDAPASSVLVTCDPSRLEQVFANLLSNAAKYGDRDAPIEVVVVADRTTVTLEVRNHGPDIAADELATLFDRYVRARTTRRAAIPGSGLGLYIARGLVDAHGGRIWATSGGGTTAFHVVLPRATADHADLPAPPDTLQPRASPPTRST